ncbi:MAG TPA: LysR family transcriptional regulator [Streptosporangiaceae bacterium]
MLDLRRLRLLRELAYRGTIAAVAGALSFTPSAVSQQLSILEREAGVRLLERSGRGVVITPAGYVLVRHAELLLAQLESAAAELASAKGGLAGPVRIGTFATAARAIIPAALIRLAGDHPGLEPMVTEIDPARVAQALRAGDLDIALIQEYDLVPPPHEPGLASEPLCSEDMYLATAYGPGARSEPSSRTGPGGADETGAGGSDTGPGPIATFLAEPWITATTGTLCHAMTIRACQNAGFEPRVRHQVDDFGTVLTLVGAGHGVALVPQLAVTGSPAGVRLTRLPIRRRTMIAFRAGAERHPAVRAVSDALCAAVPPELSPGPPCSA